jgi:hypothetical protein
MIGKREGRSSVEDYHRERVRDVSDRQISTLISEARKLFADQLPEEMNREQKNASRDMDACLEKIYARLVESEASALAAQTAFKNVIDARKQEDWADSREKFRLFVFRMATGIGLAAILLFTYWFADRLGIPMPLRMPPIP